jgi:hypothetical protein
LYGLDPKNTNAVTHAAMIKLNTQIASTTLQVLALACGSLELAVSVNSRKMANGAPTKQIKAVQSQMITKPSMQPLLKNESFTVATKNGTIVKITPIVLVVFGNFLMFSSRTAFIRITGGCRYPTADHGHKIVRTR